MPYINYYNEFIKAQSVIGAPFEPQPLVGKGIFKFNSLANTANGKQRVPFYCRTGAQSFGTPVERKRFTQIEFHGKGTLYVRVYVDGVWIIDSMVTLTETPSKDRRLGIPIGTKGYTMDIEFCGDADLRAIEYEYSPTNRTS